MNIAKPPSPCGTLSHPCDEPIDDDGGHNKVIASTQWVMPQVDIYVGQLSPFGNSVKFATASSRSNASGRCIHRHSKPNGGPTFGVVEDSGAEDDSQDVEKDEVQVEPALK